MATDGNHPRDRSKCNAGPRPTPLRRVQPVASLPLYGTSMALGSAVLILGGYWMDRRAGGGWRWTVVGLVLALAYAAYETWKLARILREEPPLPPDGGRRDAADQPHDPCP